MRRKKQLEMENARLREDLTEATRELGEALGEVRLINQGIAKSMPLDSEGLQKLAANYPRWEMEVGVMNGRVCKQFKRDLADLDPAHHDNLEIELSLTDPEHFDMRLAEIFGAYSGRGDFMSALGGGYNGGSFRIEAPEDEIFLSRFDAQRIAHAEAYLIERGYVLPPTD